MRLVLVFVLPLFFQSFAWAQDSSGGLPIIDMHMHAIPVDSFGKGREFCPGDQWKTFPGIDPRQDITPRNLEDCPNPLRPPESDEDLLRQTIEAMEKFNIVGVLAGDLATLRSWRAAAPNRFLPAFPFADPTTLNLKELREYAQNAEIAVFGEIWTQNVGLDPSGPELEPVLALAEELDVPVAIHMGPSVPGKVYLQGRPQFRSRLTNPLLLEEALIRHPKLRVYVMHAGYPMLSEMIHLLYSHPQVHVDIAVLNWYHPRKEFHRYLKGLVEAGFGPRIMFGSDFVVWPDAIQIAIESIQTADFLTEEQKRDILYGNAARFLRFSEEEIARHHGN